ncbi:uncharacterized protein LOC121874055 [Homarus americanus]|uniref:uncharacterized protein LOC121874055 n=1 Tax=Homarus americanus TaxID=6706 RepID=UPI001C496EA4|nr:uncharacterized protein LOC121874055 [Homarus americanus]
MGYKQPNSKQRKFQCRMGYSQHWYDKHLQRGPRPGRKNTPGLVLRSYLATTVVCCLLPITTVDGGTEAEIIKALEETQEEVAWKYIPLSGPSIDETNSKNITAQLGKTAVLNCRIKYLGGKTVSWMRSRDLHLLTVGRFTYTSDDRFRSVHQPGSEDWLLKIHYAQHRDAGAYECQISTTPPMSKVVWLTVVEPETRVLGGPDLYINSGSTINLTCVVNHSPEPPPYIFWYHESELLSYDSPRGGITVVTEHGPTSSSRLLIQRATVTDAGRYTCRPANADPHHIMVHIIPNEHPAAIHHKNGTSVGVTLHNHAHTCPSLALPLLLALLFLFTPNYLPSNPSSSEKAGRNEASSQHTNTHGPTNNHGQAQGQDDHLGHAPGRNYTPVVSYNKENTSAVSYANDHTVEVSYAKDQILEVSCTKDHTLEVSYAKDQNPEVSCTKDHTQEVTSIKDQNPEVSCTKDHTLEVTSIKDQIPEVSCVKDHTPDVSNTERKGQKVLRYLVLEAERK